MSRLFQQWFPKTTDLRKLRDQVKTAEWCVAFITMGSHKPWERRDVEARLRGCKRRHATELKRRKLARARRSHAKA